MRLYLDSFICVVWRNVVCEKERRRKNIFDYLTEQNRSTWTFWGFVVLFIAVFAFAGWRLWRWYSPKAEQPKAKGTTEKESGKEKKKA